MTATPSYFDWLTIFAIVIGPLLGIWVTRIVDGWKERKKQREDVFKGLLKTRGLELSPDHVSSLNLVPFFFKEAPVREAYSRTMAAVNDPSLSSGDETSQTGALIRLNAARRDLLREIGQAVGMTLPTNELERDGYAPQAWVRQQIEQDKIRAYFIEWLEGKRAAHMLAGIWELPSQPPQGEPVQADAQLTSNGPDAG